MPDGELIMSEPDCFADETSADIWAVAGVESRIKSEAAVSGSGGVAASSAFTLGKHYDGYNGTGSSVTVVGSSCSGGVLEYEFVVGQPDFVVIQRVWPAASLEQSVYDRFI